MSKIVQVEIDIAGEDGYEQRTQEWVKKFDCKAEIITHNGPAGGNPLYKVFGPEDKLRELMLDYCEGAYLSFPEDERKKLAQEELEELYPFEPYEKAS